MIMLVSVTCSSGHLVKIHNDRDNLGRKEENKQEYFFLRQFPIWAPNDSFLLRQYIHEHNVIDISFLTVNKTKRYTQRTHCK